MSVDHYENFPVASILMPRRLRPAVEAIYAFARSADDIADEGDATPEQRLAGLAAYEEALGRIERAEDGMGFGHSEHFAPVQVKSSAAIGAVVTGRVAGHTTEHLLAEAA